MYHSVTKYDSDPLLVTVSPDRFATQMRWLAARGLRGVSMRDLLAAQRSGTAGRLVGLTFDDGYADFAAEVVPVLLDHGFTATVFPVAGELGGFNTWDASAGYPRKPLMDADDVRRMSDLGMEVGSHTVGHRSLTTLADDAPRVAHLGVEVGSHTVGHHSLTTLADDELRHELVASKAALEEIVGAEVTGFCYPYGHVGAREVAAVREAGYHYACAIWKSEISGMHALPRTYVGDRDGALRLHAKRLRHRMRWWS
ncbi:polysaccharide deacetylase family protein [Nonomuraea sp. NPDC049152]|uniref:polysaccharide deacetylase family protein n=1 Tax=Nonomuraea sp. NPDC049152 TaxID=3154350 RepID=UPI0033DCA009